MENPAAAIDIDAAFVPRRREDVVYEELDGEVVVWDPVTASLYVLNPSATVVWNCLDGEASVQVLAGDLAEAFGIRYREMEGDVTQAVRGFAAQGLLEGFSPGLLADSSVDGEQPEAPATSSPTREPSGGPRLLPQSATGCSAQVLDGLGWEGLITLAVGDWLVNVRANTARTLEALRAFLEPHVVPTVEGSCQYSVVIEDSEQVTASSLGRPLHLLYRGTCAAFRSRYPAEVLSALRMFLSEHADTDGAPLRIRATMLVADDGGLVLLPDSLRAEAVIQERRLADVGLRIVQRVVGVLVPDTAEIELRPGGAVETRARVLTTLDPIRADRVEGHSEPTGRFPIRMCVVPGPGVRSASVPPAEAVRRLALMVERVADGDRRMLFGTLAAIARESDVHPLGVGSPRTVLNDVVQEFGKTDQ